jgi:hypothetical protein
MSGMGAAEGATVADAATASGGASAGTAPVEVGASQGAAQGGSSVSMADKYSGNRGPGSPQSSSQIDMGGGVQVSSSPGGFTSLMDYLNKQR